MWSYLGPIIALISLVLVYLLLCYVLLSFRGRSDGIKDFKYYERQDFANLVSKQVEIKLNKNRSLRGFLYSSEANTHKGLIIFSHGVGMGHFAYTSLIDALVQKGYLVLAMDFSGSKLSDGKRLALPNDAVLDLKRIIQYVKSDSVLSSLPLYLVGHSLGGYATINVMKVLDKKDMPTKIVAISAFDKMSDVTKSSFQIPTVLKPGMLLILALSHPTLITTSSSKSLSKQVLPSLLLHGDKDETVSVTVFNKIRTNVKDRKNIRFILEKNKKHNPYLTENAESLISNTLMPILFESLKNHRKSGNLKDKLLNFPWEKTIEIDMKVIDEISEFLNEDIS